MNPISEPSTTTASTPIPVSTQTSIADSTDHQLNALRLKCQAMELGLNDIKTALGTLKSACAMLEMQTDRLGSELAEMKSMIGPINFGPKSAEAPRSVATTSISTAAQTGSDFLITPPATPARHPGKLYRINDSIGRIVHPGHISTSIYASSTPPRQGILGKRRSTEDTEVSPPDITTNESPRSFKRVRFADIDDIPISHVRTPIDELDPSPQSKDLALPIPRLDFTNIRSNTEHLDFSETLAHELANTISPISPPTSPIILPSGKARKPTRSKFRDSMLFLSRKPYQPRQKTRWDPTMGKRVPIVSITREVRTANTNTNTTRAPTGAGAAVEGDYVKRLSDDFSNATI